MKNLRLQLLLIILLTSTSQLSAQHINVHSNETLSKISDLHRISDDEFIMVSKTLGLDYWAYGRVDWFKNGKVVRELELPFYCRDIQLHEINGEVIVDVDYNGECDTPGGFMSTFSLDTLQEDNFYPRWKNGFISSRYYYQMKRFQDSLFVAILRGDESEDPDTLRFYNLNREPIKSAILPGNEYRILEVSEKKLITYNQNTLVILKESQSNLEYTSISIDDEIINVKLDSDFFYVLTNNEIKIISYDGKINDSVSINIDGFTTSDLEYFHGSNIDTGFYIIGITSSGNDGFYQYKDGQWMNLSTELSDDFKVHDIINFDNELLWVTGNVKTYNMLGDEILQNMTYQEVGTMKSEDLISLELLEVNLLNERSVSIAYTVNNLQDKAVQDINLYSLNNYGGGICPGIYYSKNLALGALESRVIRDTMNHYAASLIVSTFCLFTSGSDRILDGDLTNNTSCTGDIVNTTTLEIREITVYPNPAFNVLNLESKYNGSSYEISSVNGQAVLKGRFYDQINIEGLNPGIYFLSIISDNEIIVSKFVKSE